MENLVFEVFHAETSQIMTILTNTTYTIEYVDKKNYQQIVNYFRIKAHIIKEEKTIFDKRKKYNGKNTNN